MNVDKDILAPLAVALISWLIKDYIFSLLQKRQEALRTEWADRLKSFWSPLFFWVGAGLAYTESKPKADEAVKALEGLLSKNAHLLPEAHYFVVVKLIEKLTVLPDREIDLGETQHTQAYIRKQIELLNFLLYKKDFAFDPKAHASILGSQQALFRLASQTIIHVLAWGLLGLYLYAGIFLFLSDRLFLLLILLSPLTVAVWRDVSKRLEMRRELKQLSSQLPKSS